MFLTTILITTLWISFFKLALLGEQRRDVGYHISLVRMIKDLNIVIFHRLEPPPLSHIQLLLGEHIFKALVVCVHSDSLPPKR